MPRITEKVSFVHKEIILFCWGSIQGGQCSACPLEIFRRRGRKWAGSNKLLTPGVYSEIQTFQGSCAKKQQIAFFRKHHLIDSKKFV